MNELGKISRDAVPDYRVLRINVDDTSSGQRIDNFLLRIYKKIPKSHIYRILRSGEVRVNTGRIDASYRLKFGDIVRVPPIWKQLSSVAASAPAATFPVLYEDDYLIALNKPTDIAVHGGSGVNFGVIEQMRAARPHASMLELVHRLDRGTSGVLLLAKKRAALIGLHDQMRTGRIDKRYLVCAYGAWPAEWGVRHSVKAPLYKYLGADGKRRVRVQLDGLASHTILNLRQRLGNYLLLEVKLQTGRTHQIRVHLAHLRLPIVGDDKYGNFLLNKLHARPGAKPGLSRMFLHAWHLNIKHPAHGAPLTFEAPLPEECAIFLQQLTDMLSVNDTKTV
ncbi:RluA family pseudouridine synthase [Candidatus Vallotia lariciata]|uniref:RluA family pseudouridine synthase n=1 Tax=Candidatus Vallotia laricis TaxID=2018052 RepID=UPI001D011F50|nr:RluA family pseudouridine synthase [Candidatus Vallotia lariciata]UDG83194.1 Ribosomal large subunit pseudouridine synthase C [Candidatus Vallotia lariciata]